MEIVGSGKMKELKIAVYLGSILPAVNNDIKAGIDKVKELGFKGVQIHHLKTVVLFNAMNQKLVVMNRVRVVLARSIKSVVVINYFLFIKSS